MNKNPVEYSNEKKEKVIDSFNKYQAQLKGYIARRVPTREDSEDLLQNVFYQLSKLDLIQNPIEQMSAWLYSVARNQIIDFRRKHREEEMPLFYNNDEDNRLAGEISELLFEEESSPETDLVKTFIWEELEIALSELPEEQRAVFELTELEGCSFKEISEITGITINTLISRKRYAVLHLRERLANLYKELLER